MIYARHSPKNVIFNCGFAQRLNLTMFLLQITYAKIRDRVTFYKKSPTNVSLCEASLIAITHRAW